MTTATATGRTSTSPGALAPPEPAKRRRMKSPYPTWFFIPAGVFYVVLFLVPTIASFYFSLTRWTLFDVEFIGFDNFVRFFQEPQLVQGFINTFIYAFLTSGAQGRARPPARRLPELADHRPRIPPRDGVLPGARQHDRRRHPVQGAHGSVRRADQRGARRRRHRRDPAGSPTRRSRSSRSRSSTSGRASGLATLIYIAGMVAIPQEYFEAAEGRRRGRVEHLPAHHAAAAAAGDGDRRAALAHRRAPLASTSSGR